MALIGTDQEDDKLVQPTSSSSPNARASLPPQGGSGGFAGGTGSGSGQGATTGVAASQQPSSQGGYTNLSQYLSANQNTGAMTGQGAENVVQQSADAAKQAGQTYSADATKDISAAAAPLGVNQSTLDTIKAGTANNDPALMAKISSGGYSYTPDQNLLNQISNASGATTIDKAALQNLIDQGKAATGTYTPTDYSGVGYSGPAVDKTAVSYGGPTTTGAFQGQTAADQAAALQAQGVVQGNVKNATGGQQGVSALLKGAYQQPNYTVGENTLDAFLAGGTQGGQQALGQAAGVGNEVSNNYAGINSALSGQISGAQDLAKATNATYANAVQNAQNTSADTLAGYGKAEQTAKDKALSDQKAAQDAASKAQAELDREAQWAASQVATAPVQPIPETNNAFSQVGGVVDQAVKGVENVPVTYGSALRGNQSAQNRAFTDLATRGINVVAPDQVATAKNAALQGVTNYGQKFGSSIAANAHNIGLAHGGEVPSYSKILGMLKGKKK